MYCLEREYLKEETKRCFLCDKWIDYKYLLLVDGPEKRFFHVNCFHRCLK